MKILLVSMPSVHAIRWIENLKDTNFELYWFDVLDKGKLDTIYTVKQFTDWKKRKLPYIKGEYFLSKKAPVLYQKIVPFLEITANEALENIILELQPDIIHSFEMQHCTYPILKTMRKFSKIKWLYSCWGNDLFHYRQFPNHLKEIKKVLKRIDFFHTDCFRDFKIANEIGFFGNFIDVIPGGGGYKLAKNDKFKLPTKERKIILVKGYQHDLGRGLNVVKALYEIENQIQNYEVVIFGAHQPVINYIMENNIHFKFYSRNELSVDQLMALMGKSLIYIGNSISDGIPNTLLESIIMGAFPIQSNPGGATEEIIEDGCNGCLILDAENISEIKSLVLKTINAPNLFEIAFKLNSKIAIDKLSYKSNQTKIVNAYKLVYASKSNINCN